MGLESESCNNDNEYGHNTKKGRHDMEINLKLDIYILGSRSYFYL